MKAAAISVIAAILAFSPLSPPVSAAQDGWRESTPPVGALDPTPDDRELVDFVSAFVRLMGVQHGYMMMLEQEPDPARVQELQDMAVTDMEAAIQRDGMTIDRYNTIALAVRDDPDLQGRVEGILQQLAADPSALE